MPSLIPGYEYDIFISYRQNDNRSGWVTEFVRALEEELAATMKDPIAIYFDANPHHGLLETHHVDESLKGKLRCVILIPILSHTYCDPRSFAWQHEFCAFKELAGADPTGLHVMLPGGNVASRILPVRTHDLDAEDRNLLEETMGEPLRAIDFVFSAPGVNRPLRAVDDETKEIKHVVFYRDQVNKVANAAKEIILGMNGPRVLATVEKMQAHKHPAAGSKAWLPFLLMMSAAIAIGYWLLMKPKAQPDAEKSIAVLAFNDISQAHDQEWFGDGVAEEIIHSLGQVPGMRVIGRTSSFFFKGKNVETREIGDRLKVDYVLSGSVKREGGHIRISASLESAIDGRQVWSRNFDRLSVDNIKVQDEIANEVVEHLTGKIMPSPVHASSDSVSTLVMQGNFFTYRNEPEKAITLFRQALEIDSTSAAAVMGLGLAEFSLNNNTDIPWTETMPILRGYAERALRLDPDDMYANTVMAWILYAYDRDYAAADVALEALVVKYPQSTIVLETYGALQQIHRNFDKVLDIGARIQRSDPLDARGYNLRAVGLIAKGQLNDALGDLEQCYRLNSKNPDVIVWLATVKLLQSKPKEALEIMSDESCVPCRIVSSIAYVHLGQEKAADEALKWAEANYGHGYPAYIAASYAAIGNKTRALYWLDKAVVYRDYSVLMFLDHPLYFGGLRGTPELKAIEKRLNLDR